MDYNTLLDMAAELGYYLAISGAETFRVEDSVGRVLSAYGLTPEVFAIPNCLTVSFDTTDGKPMTRMRRIGYHGVDLDSVERFSNLSRKICAEKPDPKTAMKWLQDVAASRVEYKLPLYLLGSFLGAAGFGWFYGGTLLETVLAGVCGILIGVVSKFMSNLKVNNFFTTILASFLTGVLAYSVYATGLINTADAAIIGALMILVPGLLFTNAMRDIIFGDTNSGVNRIVQVILVAVAIAIGTGFALNLATQLYGLSGTGQTVAYADWITVLASFVGCIGFAILFNVHGPGGLLCAFGGSLTWLTYCITFHYSKDVVTSNLIAAVFASMYSEIMARVRKYPAISYLVVSLFPLLPGAAVYFATNCIVTGDMDGFASKATQTIGMAGALAVGILIVSTTVRLWGVWKQRKKA